MTGRRSQSLAQLERDAALTRVSRARRWGLAAAAGLTAAVAALVSAIAPGRTLGAKNHVTTQLASQTTAGSGSSTKMPPLASAAALGLQGPSESPAASQAPTQSAPSQSQSQAAPTPAPAPVVSGGS